MGPLVKPPMKAQLIADSIESDKPNKKRRVKFTLLIALFQYHAPAILRVLHVENVMAKGDGTPHLIIQIVVTVTKVNIQEVQISRRSDRKHVIAITH